MSIFVLGTHKKDEEPPFTPEAAKALESLESYERDGWNLTDATAEELAGIDEDVTAVLEGRCENEQNISSYSSRIIRNAWEALRSERLRRDNERNNAIREQQKRIQDITAAATYLERAMDVMESVEATVDKRFIIPRYPVAVVSADSAQSMDDAALTRMVNLESLQVTSVGNNLDKYEHSASVLEKQGGARGKRLAKVLRAVADEYREDLEAHRANVSAAQSELDDRAKRAEMNKQARESLPETTATVDELLSRVAELEELVAKNPQ